MAKKSKADMSCARVKKYTSSDVSKAERHNERKNETYENMNVIAERIPYNVHFKEPTSPTYMEQLKQMEEDGKVSLRGLRKDATLFNEIVIDVNTMYFERNGGYEYAKQFYEEAFHFIEEKFGADNVISAVMHADERLVEPNIDNMLKVTNDGRKLALDQRMIDPMLPDDPESKVNTCIDNVHRIWEEHADTKAAQLIFCDLSTPKNDGSFNVYDDIREKLIRRGVPAEQIRFIHEATTDVQKKELFAKVRSGEVRILLGSTQKMGAGTNVQDKLVALHNLDCPWRPSDVGRILRTFKIKKNVEVTDNGKDNF